MDPGYVLTLQELREDIKEISMTCSDDKFDLLFRFHNNAQTIRIRYEQNEDNTLIIATRSPLIEVNKSCNNAMWDDLEKILRGRRFPLLSLSIRILNVTTLFLQLGIFHALDVVLGTMDRECRVTNLKIEGATELHMFGPIQRMLQYKDETNGKVTLSFRNKLDAETMRRASREMLSIRSLVLEVQNIDDMLTLLPYISSSDLKYLNLKRRPAENEPLAIDLTRVVGLDQWRNVEKLIVNKFVISTPLQELQLEKKTHVDIRLQSISKLDVDHLKGIFLTDNLRHIEFRIGFEYREDYIEEEWAMYERGAYFLLLDSLFPNAGQNFLQVARNDRVYTFKCIERQQVPMGSQIIVFKSERFLSFRYILKYSSRYLPNGWKAIEHAVGTIPIEEL